MESEKSLTLLEHGFGDMKEGVYSHLSLWIMQIWNSFLHSVCCAVAFECKNHFVVILLSYKAIFCFNLKSCFKIILKTIKQMLNLNE